MPFCPSVAKTKLLCLKSFVPVTREGVFISESFPPGYQDLGRKNRDIIGNRASPAVSHMKHRKFYEGKSAEARSPYLTFLQNCLILHFTFLPLTNLKTLYSNLDGSLSLFLHVSALRLLVSFLRSKHWKDCLLLRV